MKATYTNNYNKAAEIIVSQLTGSNRVQASTTVLAHTLKLFTNRWGFERAYNHVRKSLGLL